MKRLWFLGVGSAALLAAGCAVRPTPDPRDPAPIKGPATLLRVCYVDGDGPHLQVGDQVELATNGLGRLTIRHIPRGDNQRVVWNGGERARVRDAVLVENVQSPAQSRANAANSRRFVPVGRFRVGLGDGTEHARFDFLASKATDNLDSPEYDQFPECRVALGADEVIIRGVDDDDRHGGNAHLR
jgi:hypothetical protein